MKSILIMAALLFSGLTFANPASGIQDKVKDAKANVAEKIEKAKDMKDDLSADTSVKDKVEKVKNELSKLKKEKASKGL